MYDNTNKPRRLFLKCPWIIADVLKIKILFLFTESETCLKYKWGKKEYGHLRERDRVMRLCRQDYWLFQV